MGRQRQPGSAAEGDGARPTESAQRRYPLEDYPCHRCETQALPFLTDNLVEFGWEHQHTDLGYSARSGCPRFSFNDMIGSKPRPGTAKPVKYRGYSWKYYEERSRE